MGNSLYIDCFSGISGNMMVGALLDLGLDLRVLEKELKKIDIKGYRLDVDNVIAGSLKAKRFEVKYFDQPFRDYSGIKSLFLKSRLKSHVKKDCLEMFDILAKAEATVHGCPVEKIHFHEVGAIDSIVDIAGTAIGMDALGFGDAWCPKIPLGSGFACCMHGKIPVPAPATVEILKGLPVYKGPYDFEVTTPTGAAIIKKYVHNFAAMPEGILTASGMGAGTRKSDDIPNLLRLMAFRISKTGQEALSLLSTNIDDMSPENIAYVSEKLLKKGALDVWIENILMKKGRPGVKLCCICLPSMEAQLTDLIFCETSTLGIRSTALTRYALERRQEKIDLGYGQVTLKLGLKDGTVITAEPEYSSCEKLAERTGRPLKEIYRDAKGYFGFKED